MNGDISQRPGGSSLRFLSAYLPRSGLTMILLVVAVLSILGIFVMLVYMASQVTLIRIFSQQTASSGAIHGAINLASSGVITYNYSQLIGEYAKIFYTSTNASSSNVSLTVYQSDPDHNIYMLVLGGYCVQCYVSSTLYTGLNSSLSKFGLINGAESFNSVGISQAYLIPKGSTVIIPSGLMPGALLPNSTCVKESNTTIISMLARGDTIIYIGKNLTRSVSCSGQIIQNTNYTVNAIGPIADFIPINTTAYGVPPNSTNSTPILNRINLSGYFNTTELFLKNQTFTYNGNETYSSATGVKYLNGTFIALSNYPSIGWNNNSTKLSLDIAKIIESRYWIDVLAKGYVVKTPNESVENATVFTLSQLAQDGPGITSEINASTALIRLKLSNSGSFQEYQSIYSLKYRQNGLLSLPPRIGQTQQIQLYAQVFNASPSNKPTTYIMLYSQNLTVAQRLPISIGETGPSPVYSYSTFYLPSGHYIATLMNQAGNTYSSALLNLSNSTIVPIALNFKNGTFQFSATSNGQPVTGTQYTVSVNGAYNNSGNVVQGLFNYSLPKGSFLSYGNGTFDVMLLGDTYLIPYSYQNPGINIPPYYIEFAIAIIFVIAINKVLVPVNVDEYYIDVPDITPPKREHAKEHADSILSVFESVNNFYHWKYVPLTAEEVKNGISNNIKYGNTRASITLRNTYSVLNTLVARGLVYGAEDYYAPKRWIDASGHGIDYLVVYRKLKDFCIANAMTLIDLNQNSSADLIISNKGVQNYVKIYSNNAKIKEIEISQRYRTFIVFIDELTKQDFIDKLYGSYGANAEILKMAVDYGNVKLLDIDNLDEFKL